MVPRSPDSVIIDIERPVAALPLFTDGQQEAWCGSGRPQDELDQPDREATSTTAATPDWETTTAATPDWETTRATTPDWEMTRATTPDWETTRATTPEDGSSGEASPATLMELGASPVRRADSMAESVAVPLEPSATTVELVVENETLPRRSTRERVPPDRFVSR